jgi:hypothetical protein
LLPVGLVFALLAACDGGAAGPSASPAPTPAASSAVASLSPAAEAEAAVLAYYAEVNRAASTGHVATLESMIGPSCSCRRLVNYIRDKWATGSLRGASFTLSDLRVLDASPAAASVQVHSAVTRYEVLDSSGRIIDTVPAASATEVLELRLAGPRRWIVATIVRTSS